MHHHKVKDQRNIEKEREREEEEEGSTKRSKEGYELWI